MILKTQYRIKLNKHGMHRVKHLSLLSILRNENQEQIK